MPFTVAVNPVGAAGGVVSPVAAGIFISIMLLAGSLTVKVLPEVNESEGRAGTVNGSG